MSKVPNWIFIPGKDSSGNDVTFEPSKDIVKMLAIAEEQKACAFNTVGYIKDKVVLPLENSPYFGPKDGIFIHTSVLTFKYQENLFPEDDSIKLEEFNDYKL